MSESNINQQLAEMAQLTLLSKRISSIQETNLKNFPFVYFDGISAVSISFDLMDKPNYILYEMRASDEEITHLDKRVQALESSIRTLFWKDINLILKINGKKVYESKDGQ